MIRLAKPTDCKFFFDLYMHPQVNPWLLYEQMPEAEFEPIFDDLCSKNTLFVFSDAQNDIGMCKIIRNAYRTEHIAYLGGVAINPDYSGKGYGEMMLKDIIEYCKNIGIKRLELSTATINYRAISLYEKMGFQKEGVLRNYCYLKSRDMYIDEVMMSLLM